MRITVSGANKRLGFLDLDNEMVCNIREGAPAVRRDGLSQLHVGSIPPGYQRLFERLAARAGRGFRGV
jgi:hypothetical protein